MFSVGERLRQARLDLGLELSTVAARTKISEKYLSAIESDDRKSLPGGFFYKSFVDQYARVLSLNATEIDAEINQLLSADAPLPLPGQDGNPIRKMEPVIPQPGRARRRMYASLAVLTLVLLACSGVYAWWREARMPTPPVDAVEPSSVRASNAKPPAVASPPAVPVALATVHAQPAVAAPVAESRPTPGYKVLLDLMAREETWVSVSSDGRMVFAGKLAANQTKTIEGREFAKLRMGNAGGVEVRLNGKALGTLGARGQAIVVVFTEHNFEIVPPPKESD